MSGRGRIQTLILYVVYACYLLLLVKVLLVSRVSDVEHRAINFIPFASISEYLSGSSANLRTFALGNVGGNIVIFMPLGIFLPLFKNIKSIRSNLLFVFLASLSVEAVQGLFGIGAADVDDIILNVMGGWIGILAYKFLLLLLRDERSVRTVITILGVMGLPLMLFYLFVMRMRF